MKFKYILKSITLSGDMLIETNGAFYVLKNGAEKFYLKFPESSLDEMEMFDVFCSGEEKNVVFLQWQVIVKRLEGPLDSTTLYPAAFSTFEEGTQYLLEIGRTLNGRVQKFELTLMFSDRVGATCYTSLGELTLFDKEKPFDLKSFWVEEMEYLKEHSKFRSEREGISQILERIEWINKITEKREQPQRQYELLLCR
jgi:hypothetical protein